MDPRDPLLAPAAIWFRAGAAAPSPDELAEQLRIAQVATAAAQRIDDFDRIHDAHRERRKGQAQLAAGAVAVLCGIWQPVPRTYRACVATAHTDCAAGLSALLGSMLVLGITLWNAYDLYTRPTHLLEQMAKLNDELERMMQATNGHVPVVGLFNLYRQMPRADRERFRAQLHEATRRSPDGMELARAVAARLSA